MYANTRDFTGLAYIVMYTKDLVYLAFFNSFLQKVLYALWLLYPRHYNSENGVNKILTLGIPLTVS